MHFTRLDSATTKRMDAALAEAAITLAEAAAQDPKQSPGSAEQLARAAALLAHAAKGTDGGGVVTGDK
jgi:hypothetical protein